MNFLRMLGTSGALRLYASPRNLESSGVVLPLHDWSCELSSGQPMFLFYYDINYNYTK